MNGEVQFQEQWQPQQRVPKKGWGEKLAGLLVKYSGGLIKDETQASYVILGFVVVAIIISLFLVFGGGGTQKSAPNFNSEGFMQSVSNPNISNQK
ncbi:MAG: hypothetical protein NTX55_00335 [Candidatus Parcubacteria bacterium]|nr:hypothetical protein [Candidatus Parcubacteria bacterium]